MKTDQIQPNRPVTHGTKERKAVNPKQEEPKASDETKNSKPVPAPTKRIVLKEPVINNPEAVKELMGESIQWRDMKFYQRQEGGQTYIDIVDKSTGNVVRTVPSTKLAEVSEKLKQLSGTKFSISG